MISESRVGIFLKRAAGTKHEEKIKVKLLIILKELEFQSGFSPTFHFPKVTLAPFQLPVPRFRFSNICSVVETLLNSWQTTSTHIKIKFALVPHCICIPAKYCAIQLHNRFSIESTLFDDRSLYRQTSLEVR